MASVCSFSLFLLCRASILMWMFISHRLVNRPSTFHPDLLILRRPFLKTDCRAFDRALSPHTIDSLHPNNFLNLESWWIGLKQARWCVFICVSNGSATGQEWAGAAGFQLMMTVSIYLLFEYLSHPRRWMLFLCFHFLYVEASNLSVYCIVKAI